MFARVPTKWLLGPLRATRRFKHGKEQAQRPHGSEACAEAPRHWAQVATFDRMDTIIRDLSQAQLDADTNTNVVHAVNWAAAQAGAQQVEPSGAASRYTLCLSC